MRSAFCLLCDFRFASLPIGVCLAALPNSSELFFCDFGKRAENAVCRSWILDGVAFDYATDCASAV